MSEVSAYIAGALRKALPKEVVEKGKHHALDTLAAMVSGSRLLPGQKAIGYVRTLGGAREACVVGTGLVTSAVNAALANGMFAHADETDDSHHPSIYSPNPAPEEMVRGLGSDYEIMNTNIKKWSVGSPIQAALDSVLILMREHGIRADDVERMVIRTPDDEAGIVNDSRMPDINMQHLLAVMLLDGTLTFASAQDAARMRDPKVLNVKRRIKLVGSADLTRARPPRQCIIEIHARDGRELRYHTSAVKGTVSNPMTRSEVGEKCLDLMAPVLGKRRARTLIDTMWNLEKLADVRALRALLRA